MSESETTPAVVDTANLADTEGSAPQAETTVENTDTLAATPETTEGEAKESRRDTKAEKRIHSLNTRAKQAEDNVRILEAEKVSLQDRLNSIKPPTEEEFDYDSGQYTAAVVQNATKEAYTQAQLESKDQEIARIQQAHQAAVTQEIAEKVQEFKTSVTDYDQSVQTIVHLSNLPQAISMLDKAPEVYYALSKNPQQAMYINSLPMAQQLVALGQFSANISVTPRNVSNAPAPIESAQAGSSVETGYRDDMSMEEFSVWHDKRNSAAK